MDLKDKKTFFFGNRYEAVKEESDKAEKKDAESISLERIAYIISKEFKNTGRQYENLDLVESIVMDIFVKNQNYNIKAGSSREALQLRIALDALTELQMIKTVKGIVTMESLKKHFSGRELSYQPTEAVEDEFAEYRAIGPMYIMAAKKFLGLFDNGPGYANSVIDLKVQLLEELLSSP